MGWGGVGCCLLILNTPMTPNSPRLWHYFSFLATCDLESSGLCLDRREENRVLVLKTLSLLGGDPYRHVLLSSLLLCLIFMQKNESHLLLPHRFSSTRLAPTLQRLGVTSLCEWSFVLFWFGLGFYFFFLPRGRAGELSNTRL